MENFSSPRASGSAMRGALLIALLLVACGSSAPARRATPVIARSAHDPVDASDARAYAGAMNALGLDVWEGLRASGETGTPAISPASIALALTLTDGGAGGSTADAMRDTLHLASAPDDALRAAGHVMRAWNDPTRTTYELAIANRLFGEQAFPFRETFLAATRDALGAELARVDYQRDAEGARRTINEWVLSQTASRIHDLVPAGVLDDATRLVLVNAVYFRGRWLRELDRARTRDEVFHVPGGDAPLVAMMHAEGGRYGEDAHVQLLELPYAGEELAMLVVLPRDREGLAAVERDLDASRVHEWAAALETRHDLEIALPRFRVETPSLSLREVLVALGMGVAFSPETADFTPIHSSSEVLFVSEVIHRVFVEVNEEGTEAAAATAVVMASDEAVTDAPPRFVADHPFLFFLRDLRTGAILFAGRVVDPR